MPPKTREFVEMLLYLAWPAPGCRAFHELEDELFHGECGLPLIEGGPDSSPVRWQSPEAEDVAVPGDSAAAIRGIEMTDEPQEPHQSEESVAGDPPGTKRPVKLEAGILFEDGIGSGRQTELDVAVIGSDPDQRIQKRVR